MGYGLLKVVGTKPQVMTMGVIDLRKYGATRHSGFGLGFVNGWLV